jgi:hypothetical protein
MGSLERLANKVVNGDRDGVEVWSRHEGTEIAVGTLGDHWNGSVGAWQAALLAALSAKFVKVPPVVATDQRSEWTERVEDKYHDPMFHSGDR